MTTDVDQFESLIENGLLSALVSIVTFAGVAIALVVINPELGLLVMTLAVPDGRGIGAVPPAGGGALQPVAGADRHPQRRLPGEPVGRAGSPGLQPRGRDDPALPPAGAQLPRDPGRRPASGRAVLPVHLAVRRAGARTPSCSGVGAGLVVSGRLSTGALIAFILYIDMFFSPIQQLSQVFDSWQQTRVSVGRIADLMALETKTPAAADPVEPGRLRGEIELESVRFAYPAPVGRLAGGGGPPAANRRGPRDAPSLLSPDASAAPAARGPPRRRSSGPAGRDGCAGRRNGGREVDPREAHRPLLRP